MVIYFVLSLLCYMYMYIYTQRQLARNWHIIRWDDRNPLTSIIVNCRKHDDIDWFEVLLHFWFSRHAQQTHSRQLPSAFATTFWRAGRLCDVILDVVIHGRRRREKSTSWNNGMWEVWRERRAAIETVVFSFIIEIYLIEVKYLSSSLNGWWRSKSCSVGGAKVSAKGWKRAAADSNTVEEEVCAKLYSEVRWKNWWTSVCYKITFYFHANSNILQTRK